MQRQYTEKAKKAIELAKKSAKRLKHSYIGSEHILIGLLEEGSAVGARVLEANGVDEDALLELMEQLIVPEGNVGLLDKEGFTPRAEKVLEAANREAERFKANKIGTEHLLIAMVKEADSVATKLLITLGINLQKVYVDTLAAMGQEVNLYREDFQNGRLVKKKEKEATPTLNQYSRDLTMLAKEQKLDPVVSRENEIQRDRKSVV